MEHDHGISGYPDQGGLIIPDIHLNADDAGAAHRLPLNSIERKDAAIVPHQAVARQVALSIAAKNRDFSSKFPSIKISKDT